MPCTNCQAKPEGQQRSPSVSQGSCVKINLGPGVSVMYIGNTVEAATSGKWGPQIETRQKEKIVIPETVVVVGLAFALLEYSSSNL